MPGPRTYCQQPLAVGTTVNLDDIATGHLIRVLRLKDGDPVRLFNGDGSEYAAQLCNVAKKSA
ncbi:MAG: RNA methyltransferase PUA domain-containing protein, partial [Pseudomonadota bacterium]